MPLPPPVQREPLHRRTIEVLGYRRHDELWDIEAHLVDTKTHVYSNRWRGAIEPGEPVHDMWLRLTVDTGFTIRDVEAASDKNPYPDCPGAAANYKRLVGLKIGHGWRAQLKERVGAADGCSHLHELLGPIGAVMFQTILPYLYESGEFSNRPRPGLVDSCYAYRSGGEVVQTLWPNLGS